MNLADTSGVSPLVSSKIKPATANFHPSDNHRKFEQTAAFDPGTANDRPGGKGC